MDNEDISEHIGTGDGSSSDGSDETGTSDGNDAIYKHSGICGDITWTIDQEGTLCLSGSGDFEYQNVGIFIYDKEGHEFFSRYIEAPWLEYATEIIHAKVNVQGVSSLQGIFSGGYMLSPDFEWIDTNICTNLVTVDFSGSDLSNVTSSFIAFQGCTALKSVNMEGLSMPGWIYAAATFDACGGTASFSQKRVAKGDTYGTLPTAEKYGYLFEGWYTSQSGGDRITEDDVVNNFQDETMITLYAHWCTEEICEEDCLDRFYVSGYENTVDYCGTAITFPNIQVKYKGRVLTYGTDYTVKYSNNIRAAKATDEKAPTILILGKGVLKGKKETVKFTINPLDMENAVLSDVAVKENGKVQWKTTTITYNVNNKLVTLKKNRDFTYQYNDQSTGAYTVPGTYSVSVVGKGNYTGTTGFQEIIIDKKSQEQKLVSKLKISGFRSKVKYADGPICQDSIVVKDGTTPLTEGVDYTISYYDNEECGTAQMIIEGTGIKYVGSKVLKYKIVGTSISHATVEGIEKSYIYTGKAYVPEPSVYVKGVKLEAGTDYEFSYTNNVNAGKATVIISGKGKYSGTLKKYFRITAYNILEKDEVKLISVSPIEDVKYAAITKSGARPEVSVIYDGKVLVNGIDYTLKYTNNKKIASAQDPKKAPTVTIKGRGNFKGSLKKTFSIVE